MSSIAGNPGLGTLSLEVTVYPADRLQASQPPVSLAPPWRALRAAPFAALLVDADGIVLGANDSAHTLWNADRSTLLTGRVLIGDLLSPSVTEASGLPVKPGGCWSAYVQAQRFDGTTLELDGHFYPLGEAGDAARVSVFVAQLSRSAPRPRIEPEASVAALPAQHTTDRFRVLVERAPVEVWLMTEDFRIEYVNAAACDSLGLSAADLVGRSIHEIDINPPPPQSVVESLMVLGQKAAFESAHRHADGHAVPKEIVCSVFEVGGRRFIGSFARDISERLAAAAALVERESTLNTVLEAFPGIVGAFTDTCRPLYVNEELCRMLKRTRQEVMASTTKELLDGERTVAINDVIARLRRGETVHEERSVRSSTGEEAIFRTRFVMQQDPVRPGHEVFFAFGTDVTELRREQRRLASFVAGARAATWEWSPRDGSLRVNEYFAELTGYSSDEARAGVSFWLLLVHDDDRPKRKALMQEVLQGSRDQFECEYRATHKSGRELWLVERAKVLRHTGDGVPLVIFGTLQDISQLRHTDAALSRLLQELEARVAARTAELREATANAERANNAKSEFLSFMSHELRTPLNAISGFGQLLSLSTLDAEQRQHVGEILVATDLLVRLIDDILDLASIEAGRVPLTLEVVPLVSLFARNLEIIRSVAKRSAVTVLVGVLPEGLGVWADKRRLKQVLLNLATNAAKYNRPGGMLTLSALKVGDASVEFSVSDQGYGLTEDQKGRLFKPFERLGAAGGPVEGTGVGLTITKRLVELMHGSIDVESILGIGSTFRVRLPAAPEDLVVRSTSLDNRVPPITPDASGRSRPAVVLYVEDDPASGRLVEGVFKLLPAVEFHLRADPAAALHDVLGLRPDLLLLDLGLPGMSGAALLGRLRELGVDVPALAVSALAGKADIESALAAGFLAHIKKPVDVVDLLSRVQNLFSSLRP